MGTVSFDYYEYNIVTNSMQKKYASGQPTLDTVFGDSSQLLYDGQFTTLDGSDITEFPYTGNLGGYANTVLISDESINYGVKLKTFGRGIGNGFKYFDNNNTYGVKNKCVCAIPIQQYDQEYGVYPLKVFETDTIEITVESVTKYTDSGYEGYTLIRNYQGDNRVLDVYAPTYTQEQLNSLVHSVYVKVHDKTLGTDYTTQYYCTNIAGVGCRFGAPDSKLYITLLIMNNYNPKYVCDSVNSAGYVQNLTDKGEMLQQGADGAVYSNEPGTMSSPLIAFCTNYYTNNTDKREYFCPAFVDSKEITPENIFKSMYDSSPDNIFEIDPFYPEFPHTQANIEYWEMSSTTASDIPEGWYVATNTHYDFNIHYINEYGFRIMARFDEDTGRWHIGNVITDYAEPEPEDNPDDYQGEDWEPGNYPDIHGVEPKPRKRMGSAEKNTAELDGKSKPGVFDGYDNIQTDELDGLNGKTISEINNAHKLDTVIYYGVSNQIAWLRDSLTEIFHTTWIKALLALNNDIDVDTYITRVYELPFNPDFIESTFNHDWKTPCYQNIPLTIEPTKFSALQTFLDVLALLFDNVTDLKKFFSDANLSYKAIYNNGNGVIRAPLADLFKNWNMSFPSINMANRFGFINFGWKYIDRMFGNNLDFEEVKYKLLLPAGNVIELDPNLLFRDRDAATGTVKEVNRCELHVVGHLDIQTGDMLITVRANDNMIYQTTVNLALERTLNGTDQTGVLRSIVDAVLETAKMAALGAAPLGVTSMIGKSGWKRHDTGQNVKDASGNVKLTQSPRDLTQTPSHEIRYPSFNPGSIIKDSIEFSSGGKPINITQGSTSGSTKLIANLLPTLVIDYPVIKIPNGTIDEDTDYEMLYDYVLNNGLNSMTPNPGIGYNQYGIIHRIKTPFEDGPWAPTGAELDEFMNMLTQGFYIYSTSNVKPSSQRYYESTYRGYTTLGSETQEPEIVDIIPGRTDRIAFRNINTIYEQYVDKWDSFATEDTKKICYECFPYDIEDILNPVIDIDGNLTEKINYRHAIYNGRFYTLVKKEYVGAHIIRLYYHEDVLTTWYPCSVIQGLLVKSSAYFDCDLHNDFPLAVTRCISYQVFSRIEDQDHAIGSTLFVQSNGQWKPGSYWEDDAGNARYEEVQVGSSYSGNSHNYAPIQTGGD